MASTLTLLGGLLAATGLHGPAAPECRLTGAQQRWIESALASWNVVRGRALRLPDAPMPTLILFDNACTFTLPSREPAPRSMQVRVRDERLNVEAAAHGGAIRLPNGRTVPARPFTFSSLTTGDTATFVLIALADVWRRDPSTRAMREDWDSYLRRALVHEMTHARQLGGWVPVARIAGGRVGLDDVDDDVVQQRFQSRPGFREAVEREIALLFDAAAASTDRRRRQLVRDALDLMRDRRERFFGGATAPWSVIEQLWLDLEGAAQWAALAHLRLASPRMGARARLDVVRESRTFWSQEQGLGLYLALDALVPGWQDRVFAADPRSSLELLEEALAPDA